MNLGAIKYDRVVTADDESSVAKLVHWIKPGSKVLECGPATGIMSKILKNDLNCDITAIEIDAEAAKIAQVYCSKMIVANLEQLNLCEALGQETFDYVIFADVLEHLINPLDALLKTKIFLKPEGEILISVPNISHAVILGELIQGKFDYQKDGLLDNTHLHFFTRKSVIDICKQAKLSISDWKRTIREPEKTEFAISYQSLPANVRSLFNSYPDNDTYQFLARLSPLAAVDASYENPVTAYSAQEILRSAALYFSANSTFREQDSLHQVLKMENKIAFELPAGAKNLRFDAVDSLEPYAILDMRLQTAEGKTIWDWALPSGSKRGSYLLQNVREIHTSKALVHIPMSRDPQIYINLDEAVTQPCRFEVELKFDVFPYWQEEHELATQPNEVLQSIKQELIAIVKMADDLRDEAKRGWAAHNILEIGLAEARSRGDSLQSEINHLSQVNAELGYERSRLIDRINHLNHIVDAVWKSRSWKATRPLRAIALIARSLKGIARKSKQKLVSKLKRLCRTNYALFRYMAKAGYFTEQEKYSIWTAHQPKANTSIVFKYQPKISVILPVYKTPLRWLKECIQSVLDQSYQNWELCISDDCSNDPGVRSVISTFANSDARIKYIYRDKNGHIAECSQSALEIATGEFISLLDHDDLLHKDALYWVVSKLNEDPSLDFIYSNEDKLNLQGILDQPAFKPAWSPEYFLSFMYTGHLATYRTELARKAGGFRKGTEGSQDYDLTLRITESTKKIAHIPRILYHWREHPDSIAMNLHCKEYAFEAARNSLNSHFKKICSRPTEVSNCHFKGIYRMTPAGKISVESFKFNKSVTVGEFKTVLNQAAQSTAEFVFIHRDDCSFPNDLPASLCAPLSIKEVAASSPILVYDGKVIACGYGVYKGRLVPLLQNSNFGSAGFGARLAAMHNVALITLDVFAIKREVLAYALASVMKASTHTEIMLALSSAIQKSGNRIVLIPEKVDLPEASAIVMKGKLEADFREFYDPFLNKHINFENNLFSYL